MTLAAGELHYTALWCRIIADDWKIEVPLKLHRSHGDYAVDGTPEWTKEFADWLERDRHEDRSREDRGPYQNSPQRIRTTRALRKLRKQAPQEFLVIYDLAVLNPITSDTNLPVALSAVARRLNERAITKGYPERYTRETVEILAFSAIHKLAERWL